MYRRTARSSFVLVACSLVVVGCSGDDSEFEIIEVTVTGQLPDPITFSWEGNMTMLSVMQCGDRCSGLRCIEHRHLGSEPDCTSGPCSPQPVWDIDFDHDATISAPVIYGSFEGSAAEPLIAGVLHGVEVGRAEPCPDDPGPDCGIFVAGGCALFTP